MWLYAFMSVCTVTIFIAGKADLSIDVNVIVIIALAFAPPYCLQCGHIGIIYSLQIESATNSLTGLQSRKAGMEQKNVLLPLMKRLRQPCAVYHIDIEYFKRYNDTYGHMQGDEIIVKVADCIWASFIDSQIQLAA